MNMITVTAKTLDEAITKALIDLGTTSDNLDYEVIEKGSPGFLGLFGKNVVIRAKKKREDDDLEAFLSTGKIDSSSLEPVKEKKEPSRDQGKEKKRETVKEENKETPKKNSQKNQRSQKSQQQRAQREEAASETRESVKPAEKPAPKKVEKQESASAAVSEEEKKPAKKIDVEACEKAAKEFLGQVFGAMGMEVAVSTTFEEKDREMTVNMEGADMGILIGKRGQTLDSLQYLTSLVVNKECEGYVRVKLDTENYRERRKDTLETLARNIAYKVKRTRRSVSLEPMNPYERRIIHAALQSDRYVVTRSEGEDPFRHVVISLRREGRDRDRREGRRNQGQNQSQTSSQAQE